MITDLDTVEIAEVGGGQKQGGGAKASVPEVVAEAVVGFVMGMLEVFTDGK